MKHYLLFLCLISFSLTVAGQTGIAGQTTEKEKAPDNRVAEDGLVHLGDVIDVDVLGGFEFDWRGTLTPDGFLDGLDGFGEMVYGLCRTEAEIAADVVRIYSKTLREPKIIVRIIDRSNRAVIQLEGAVKSPARFRVQRPVTLRELIVIAGGLTDGASGEITIFRPKNLSCVTPVSSAAKYDTKALADNGSRTINIKISDLLNGDPAANPLMLSGDNITVMRALPIYIIGAVNSPKPIYVRSEITVSRAVAAAGGLAKDAEGNKVSVFRREGGETRIIDTDLGKIKRGESPDEVLKPFDIIDVVAKGRSARKYQPVDGPGDDKGRGKGELPLRVVY